MPTKPISFRLEPELVPLVEQHARSAGQDRSAYLASLVESHIRGNGHAQPTPSDEFLARHDQILLVLRSVTTEATKLREAVAHKEREAGASFGELGKSVADLRADIATMFAAALQSFAGVDEKQAVAFTQTYMYPANGRS